MVGVIFLTITFTLIWAVVYLFFPFMWKSLKELRKDELVNTDGPTIKRLSRMWYESEDGYKIPYGDINVYPIEAKYLHERRPAVVTHKVYYKGKLLAADNTGYSSNLVLAMVRPTLLERCRQFIRVFSFQPKLLFSQAVLNASVACEKCSNILHYEYGTKSGYSRYSSTSVNTKCELCEK